MADYEMTAQTECNDISMKAKLFLPPLVGLLER